MEEDNIQHVLVENYLSESHSDGLELPSGNK